MTLLLELGNIDQQTHNTLEMQAELSGPGNGWVDIAQDVQLVPALQLDYGIQGAGPTDLVAGTGRMTFALDNGQSNSAHLLGYYSPNHPSCRTGWAIGIGIRLVYRLAGVVYYKFAGTLDAIDPISGKYGERKVLCSVVDWIDEAAIYRPNVATQLSKRADEILTTLKAAVPRQPLGTDFDTGDATFTYALDTDLNESDPVLTVLQRLAQSEYGRIYIKGDTNTGGVLTFEKRSARFGPTSVATFNDTMISLSAPHDRTLLINRVKATTHPRTVDAAATTVLFTLTQTNPSIHGIAAGQTITLEGDYTDSANRSARVGGTEMVTPAATTDYTANTLANGTGTDLTASIVVSAEYGSNRVKYAIRNGSGSAGFITKLQARGKGLYDYTPVDNISTDAPSIALYGERQLALDMPYESTVSAAASVGDYVLSVWASPAAVAVAMPLIPPTNTDLVTMIAREPGDAITVTETVTGISSIYFINHVSMRFETLGLAGGDIINFEWILQKALAVPVVQARTKSEVTVANVNHTVSLPATVSGDLFISAFSVPADQGAVPFVVPTVTWPAGWTEFKAQQQLTFATNFPLGQTSLAYRKADGTEGSSITVTTSSAQQSTAVTYRISGAADPATQVPEAASAYETNTTPDCPALTPTGGSKPYLWLAVIGIHNPNPNLFPQYFVSIPPNYGTPTFEPNTVAGTIGWATGIVERSRRAASEDPGPFVLPWNSSVVTFTVAIHPATV